MAARYWSCRKCSHRNIHVTNSRKCQGCGENTKRARRGPAHEHALRDVPYEEYVRLNRDVHGVDEFECAVCGLPGPEEMRLNRDHAHHSGGYPRGLVHFRCNAILGQVERGREDAEALLLMLHAYMRRARTHHEQHGSTA